MSLHIDRRRLFGVGVAAGAEFFTACSPKPDQRKVIGTAAPEAITTVDTSSWAMVTVNRGEVLANASLPQDIQVPQIGLTELYISLHPSQPVVGIATVWDQNFVSLNRNGSTAPGKVGLQEIKTPFVPSLSQAHTSLNTNDPSLAGEVGIEMRNGMLPFIVNKRGSVPNPQFTLFNVQSAPLTGKEYALLFGENYVQFNGRPSPFSYIATRFKFNTSS